MLGTKIYGKDRNRKNGIFILTLVAVVVFFIYPIFTVKNIDSKINDEKSGSPNHLTKLSEDQPKSALPIDAEELYLIRTQSNEYIIIVDARSEEEYKVAHISGSKSLSSWMNEDLENFPRIRVFFYSNNATRSKAAANMYAAKGIRSYYVVGGLNVWEKIKGLRLVDSE